MGLRLLGLEVKKKNEEQQSKQEKLKMELHSKLQWQIKNLMTSWLARSFDLKFPFFWIKQ